MNTGTKPRKSTIPSNGPRGCSNAATTQSKGVLDHGQIAVGRIVEQGKFVDQRLVVVDQHIVVLVAVATEAGRGEFDDGRLRGAGSAPEQECWGKYRNKRAILHYGSLCLLRRRFGASLNVKYCCHQSHDQPQAGPTGVSRIRSKIRLES